MIDPELVTWVKPSLADVWITRLDGELVREPIKPVLAIVIGPIAATLIVGLVAVPAPRTVPAVVRLTAAMVGAKLLAEVTSMAVPLAMYGRVGLAHVDRSQDVGR